MLFLLIIQISTDLLIFENTNFVSLFKRLMIRWKDSYQNGGRYFVRSTLACQLAKIRELLVRYLTLKKSKRMNCANFFNACVLVKYSSSKIWISNS